jgi:hypothetical protein
MGGHNSRRKQTMAAKKKASGKTPDPKKILAKMEKTTIALQLQIKVLKTSLGLLFHGVVPPHRKK